MFKSLLKNIKVIVFDIDDTLLLWIHDKRWEDETLKIKRAFTPDEKWNAVNKEKYVYEDTLINLAIRDGLLPIVNEINQKVYKTYKKDGLKEIIDKQIKIFALSADTSKYAMQNKTDRLMSVYPGDFYEENILCCDAPEQKIKNIRYALSYI